MLGLSAAFDIIDHSIMFKRFQCSYGITGNITVMCTVCLRSQKTLLWLVDEHVQYTLPRGKAWVEQKNFPRGSVFCACFKRAY